MRAHCRVHSTECTPGVRTRASPASRGSLAPRQLCATLSIPLGSLAVVIAHILNVVTNGPFVIRGCLIEFQLRRGHASPILCLNVLTKLCYANVCPVMQRTLLTYNYSCTMHSVPFCQLICYHVRFMNWTVN